MEKNWQQYLADSGFTESKIQDELEYLHIIQQQENEIKDIYTPYLDPFNKPVEDRKGPKVIVKKKVPSFKGSEKLPPFSFNFVCLVTGDKSRILKEVDYPYYGILPEYKNTGGPFKTFEDIQPRIYDSLKEFREEYYNKLSEIHFNKANVSGLINHKYLECRSEWFRRYDEYLNSESWLDKRHHIMGLDEYKCLLTGAKDNLQVHHIIYDSVGNEDSNHCITLSREAHQKIHSVSFQERRDIEYKCLNKRLGYCLNAFDPNNVNKWFN